MSACNFLSGCRWSFTSTSVCVLSPLWAQTLRLSHHHHPPLLSAHKHLTWRVPFWSVVEKLVDVCLMNICLVWRRFSFVTDSMLSQVSLWLAASASVWMCLFEAVAFRGDSVQGLKEFFLCHYVQEKWVGVTLSQRCDMCVFIELCRVSGCIIETHPINKY